MKRGKPLRGETGMGIQTLGGTSYVNFHTKDEERSIGDRKMNQERKTEKGKKRNKKIES